jgi:maltoporin
MDSPVSLPGIRGLKITLVAGIALLTTDALFAQSTDQSGVDSLKTQMSQMQRQYEQRIEAMEAKMKALESNANSGSVLNARVLTDADGKEVAGKAPAPMLDESFLKSLTRNFTFSVYIRSGVGFNGNGGPQDFDFHQPDFPLGRFRLGNENDTYMELTWKQAHLLGDSPDVMDVSMTFTEAITYNTTKTTFSNQFVNGSQYAMRQAYLEAKNFIKSAPEITVWGGQRFYERHDIHLHDLFFDDYSGYGMGVDNIDLGFGKLEFAYLGGIRDDIASGNGFNTNISDPRRSGLYLHTLDLRIHDINLLGGQLELIGDYQFLKGGTYNITGSPDGPQDPIKIGDTSGGRVGAIYYHPFGPTGGSWFNTSFWQVAVFYGYGASELFGVDPTNQGGTFAGYNLNDNLGHINSDGSVSSSSLRRASQFRAIAQAVWNVAPNFAIAGEVHYRYDDQGALASQVVNPVTGKSSQEAALGSFVQTTGGAGWQVGGGIRPVFWVTDWLAIQGQAGIDYVHNNRPGGQAFNPNGTVRNDSFGKSGALGVFTIAPTIKPKGNWWTRPEFRVFATYAIWDKSLRGAIGGTPYQNADQGWVLGTQVESFF